MANSLIYKWTLFCITEACNVLATQKNIPTVCPNNSAHTIQTTGMTYEIEEGVSALLDPTKNQGYYSAKGINFSCGANTTTTYDFSIPYDIILLSGTVLSEDFNQGDNLTILMTPDLPVGGVTANANIGDTIINISPTAVTYFCKGMCVQFGDAVNYIITNINIVNSTMSLSTPLTSAYPAGSVTYRNIRLLDNITLSSSSNLMLGTQNPSHTYVPANYIFRFLYTNNTSVVKTLNFLLEHY